MYLNTGNLKTLSLSVINHFLIVSGIVYTTCSIKLIINVHT